LLFINPFGFNPPKNQLGTKNNKYLKMEKSKIFPSKGLGEKIPPKVED